MLGGIFIHIYESTFGQPGTFQAMIRGAVSEAWAWTFHPAWYKQVTGRDPQQACEEARRQMTTASKPTKSFVWGRPPPVQAERSSAAASGHSNPRFAIEAVR